jgi:hypothetical protein
MKVTFTRRIAVLGVALAALFVFAAPTEGSPLPSTGDGSFHVARGRIIGPDGNEFVPRGVNKSGLEYSPYGYDIGAWNFQRMKSWGVNFVRVPLNDAFWLARMCSYNHSYQSRVDRIVSWARELGMLVLLDDHMSSKGLTCGMGRWTGPQKAPDTHNLDFVKAVAKRYKDNPWVAIDLYNEPHDIGNDVWRSGGLVDGWRAVGMQQLLDGVRSTGNNNLVFVSGNAWANDLRMVVNNPLREDANVVYAAHSYPFECDKVTIPASQPYVCRGVQYPPHLDTQVAPLIGRRAVMITEFGTQRTIPGEMQAPIDWAEAHGIGWAAWLWSNGKAKDFCLLSEGGGNTPSVAGVPVQQALFRANGWTS